MANRIELSRSAATVAIGAAAKDAQTAFARVNGALEAAARAAADLLRGVVETAPAFAIVGEPVSMTLRVEDLGPVVQLIGIDLQAHGHDTGDDGQTDLAVRDRLQQNGELAPVVVLGGNDSLERHLPLELDLVGRRQDDRLSGAFELVEQRLSDPPTLDELALLAESAGYRVCDRVVCRRRAPDAVRCGGQ